MSSNIKVQRICQQCHNEFTALTTTTRYCSKRCNGAAHKAKLKALKIGASNEETQRIKTKPAIDLKSKEFLTVRNVATLLNSSIRTAYRLIETGKIQAVNLSERKTLVKRSEIDKLFEQPKQIEKIQKPKPETVEYQISECYTILDIQKKYSVSESTIYAAIKRFNIPRLRKGKSNYIPKAEIDKVLS